MIAIAIDGPSGAGKSTLARRLAKELGYVYVDTGAMFRAVGLYALRKGVPPRDGAAVQALLDEIDIRLSYEDGAQHIYLNGENVTAAVRAEAVGMAASGVSAFLPVRDHLPLCGQNTPHCSPRGRRGKNAVCGRQPQPPRGAGHCGPHKRARACFFLFGRVESTLHSRKY